VTLLKTLVNLVVATLVGALGDKLFGVWGMLLGFHCGRPRRLVGGAAGVRLRTSQRPAFTDDG